MKRTNNILIMASEMHPYAKVGGLGDVVSSLSAALKKLDNDVRVAIPRYGVIDVDRFNARICLPIMGVWMGGVQEWCSVWQTASEAGVPVYLIEYHEYFQRPGLYHDASMRDYADNPMRFGFFTRAALQLCREIGFRPDVVHANDWQTALAPAYLKIWHHADPVLGSAASALTIHNAAYQGIYPGSHCGYLGLERRHFADDGFDASGSINFLQAGLRFADVVTAVSPSFARDMTAPLGGFGLSADLARRADDLVGILNGIDNSLWDPGRDPLLPARYGPGNLEGKRACKRRLQEVFGLSQDDHIPVIGAIGRFVEQKGFHIIAQAIEEILRNMHVQFVILGSGEEELQRYFAELPARYGGRAGSFIGFDDRRAHLIEAGCDFFLMPSLFEPCGLNQMYSQRYGTLPIVHATGGLDDTVDNYNEATGEGTGFKFREPSPLALYYTVGWAVSTYYDRPDHLRRMIGAAMARDFSWKRSAADYETVYGRAIANRKKSDEKG
ncbi:MAG: glycogen synthase [Proteobacteria bacterium]|nr:glycogen synthase [Pseudomonadota bacterium]